MIKRGESTYLYSRFERQVADFGVHAGVPRIDLPAGELDTVNAALLPRADTHNLATDSIAHRV